MNEYRGGEMSTEVVVDGNLWTEIVDRGRQVSCECRSMVHGSSSWPILTLFYFSFFFSFFLT